MWRSKYDVGSSASGFPSTCHEASAAQWRSGRGKETRRKLDQEKIKEHKRRDAELLLAVEMQTGKKEGRCLPAGNTWLSPVDRWRWGCCCPPPRPWSYKYINATDSYRTDIRSPLSLVDQSSFVRLTAHNNPSLSDSGPQFLLRLKQAPPSFKLMFWLPGLHNGWGFWETSPLWDVIQIHE